MFKVKGLPHVVQVIKGKPDSTRVRFYDHITKKEGYLPKEIVFESLPIDLEDEVTCIYINEDAGFSEDYINNIILYASHVGKVYVKTFSSGQTKITRGVEKSFCNVPLSIIKAILLDKVLTMPSRVLVIGEVDQIEEVLSDKETFETSYCVVDNPKKPFEVKASSLYAITGKVR